MTPKELQTPSQDALIDSTILPTSEVIGSDQVHIYFLLSVQCQVS